jgi:hypothetical protein
VARLLPFVVVLPDEAQRQKAESAKARSRATPSPRVAQRDEGARRVSRGEYFDRNKLPWRRTCRFVRPRSAWPPRSDPSPAPASRAGYVRGSRAWRAPTAVRSDSARVRPTPTAGWTYWISSGCTRGSRLCKRFFVSLICRMLAQRQRSIRSSRFAVRPTRHDDGDLPACSALCLLPACVRRRCRHSVPCMIDGVQIGIAVPTNKKTACAGRFFYHCSRDIRKVWNNIARAGMLVKT